MKLLQRLLVLSFLFLSSNAFAVTDFDVSVKDSGGDYSSFATVEAAFDVDLTDAIVLPHSGITGSISDGASITGVTSSATGTVAHATSTQILIYGITGTFQSEQIQVDASNHVTSTSAGDDGAVVITFYNDFTDGTWDGGTYDSVNTMTLQGDTSGLLEAAWDGKVTGGVLVTASGWGSFKISDTNITVKNLVLDCDNGACFMPNVVGTITGINLIADGGGFQPGNVGGSFLDCVNCVSIDSVGNGFKSHYSGTTINIYNSIAINSTTAGFDGSYVWGSRSVIYNSASFGATTDFTNYTSVYGDYNTCSDTSCSIFTNNQQSLTMATELVDGGNGDIHLNSGSNLIDAGSDYSGTTGIDYDIDIVTRTGTWDIGADEYVSAVTGHRIPTTSEIRNVRIR